MGRKFLQLNATSRGPRHQIIELAKDAITASGGWIIDFRLFSNLSICINFELPFDQVGRLRDALAEIDMRLSDAGFQTLEALAGITNQDGQPAELMGSLQITFIHDDPDLRIPVPMIPG